MKLNENKVNIIRAALKAYMEVTAAPRKSLASDLCISTAYLGMVLTGNKNPSPVYQTRLNKTLVEKKIINEGECILAFEPVEVLNNSFGDLSLKQKIRYIAMLNLEKERVLKLNKETK